MAYGVFKGEKGKGSNLSNNSLGLFPARVKAVILDSTTYKNLYEAFGEEASIGGITFEKLEYPSKLFLLGFAKGAMQSRQSLRQKPRPTANPGQAHPR